MSRAWWGVHSQFTSTMMGTPVPAASRVALEVARDNLRAGATYDTFAMESGED